MQEVVTHLGQYLLGTLLGGANRQLHHGHQYPLILFRHKGGGQAHKEHAQHRHQYQIDEAITHAAFDHLAHAALIAVGTGIKGPVKPAEEAALFAKLAVLDRLEDGGAQGWRQDQRHHDREHHGRDYGQGELAIDGAGGTTEEGHGHKDRREHQGYPHQGAGDLIHGLAGGLQRREILLAHQPFHVLHHHYGVIHQQTYGQHHAEHGQGVDGEAKRRHHAKGAQQHHGHGYGGDQGGAEVLQEEVHDAEDQHYGLEQRLHHLLDGDLHKGGGVVGIDHLHIAGEVGGERVDLGLHLLGGIQRVGAGSQLDGEGGGGLTVVLGLGVEVLARQLDARHILEADLGSILIHPQQHITKLLGGGEAALPHDGGSKLLIADRWGTAELAQGDLGVLGLDGSLDIGRGQLIAVELVGIQPDAHGVLATEQLDLAHAIEAA